MPFCFEVTSKHVAENFASHATPNTEIDAAFVKPGASRPVSVIGLILQGKGASLTAMSAIIMRLKQWTSTASSVGTSITPSPTNPLNPAAVATAAAASAGVTSGTGGPTINKALGCGAAGPGAWNPQNADAPPQLDGGANKSLDLFVASPTASLNYEFSETIQECG